MLLNIKKRSSKNKKNKRKFSSCRGNLIRRLSRLRKQPSSNTSTQVSSFLTPFLEEHSGIFKEIKKIKQRSSGVETGEKQRRSSFFERALSRFRMKKTISQTTSYLLKKFLVLKVLKNWAFEVNVTEMPSY